MLQLQCLENEVQWMLISLENVISSWLSQVETKDEN